jgi:hypothetical protein
MYDVPHLSLKLSQSTETVGLQADLIAKDDLMYAQVRCYNTVSTYYIETFCNVLVHKIERSRCELYSTYYR